MRPVTYPPQESVPNEAMWSYAIRGDDAKLAIFLIAKGYDPAQRLRHGMTPAILCAMDGKANFLRGLAQAAPDRLDLDAVCDYASSAVFQAVVDDHLDILNILASLGAAIDPQIDNDMSPAMIAAQNGSTRCLARLIELGADLSKQNSENMTPLHLAASRDNPDIVHMLLKAGAPAHSEDRYGHIPLHCAAASSQSHIAEILCQDRLARGLDVDPRARCGDTPLMLASRHGRVDIVQAFLAAGADPRLANAYGQRAADHAQTCAHLELATHLRLCAQSLDDQEALASCAQPATRNALRPRI